MAEATARDKIVKALLEHSRKQGRPLSEMDVLRGIQVLYMKMGEAAVQRYKGNLPLLAEDIRAAVKAQERVGGLRPILVHGELKLVPAGRRTITSMKAIPVLLKKKGLLKRPM